jgi:hypothetical protein
LYELFWIIQT